MRSSRFSLGMGPWKLQPPSPGPSPSCPNCPPNSAQKPPAQDQPPTQQQSTNCKNGSIRGQCVPDSDIHKDGCYTLSGTCGTPCTSFGGQCVERCSTWSCTEYLNQKSSKELAARMIRFGWEHGGKGFASCVAAGSGIALIPGGATTVVGGLIAAVCTAGGVVTGAHQGMALEEIAATGGCLAVTTTFGGLMSYAPDKSGFCTAG